MHEEHFNLSEAAKAHISGLLSSGECISASDYIESLIQEDRMTRRQLLEPLESAPSAIEKLALEGLDSGPPQEADQAYWRAKRANVIRVRDR